jgi:hypothetical protein
MFDGVEIGKHRVDNLYERNFSGVASGVNFDEELKLLQLEIGPAMRSYFDLRTLDTCWWARRDLNPQPRDYESPALTVELQALQ